MQDPSGIDGMKEAILREAPRMGEGDAFAFGCDLGAPCFTQCCADVTIALTPYDVARLRRRLGITSGEFMERHALVPFTAAQALPVPILRMREDERKTCPFLGDQGCSVYEDRPWACRMYPVGVASPRDRTVGEKFFFLLKEDLCQGHGRGRTWTVREWMEDQGAAAYDERGEAFKAVTLHDFFRRGGRLDPAKMEMYFMVCYDLDRFRRFVFDSSFSRKFNLDAAEMERAKTDDEALQALGFRWLRFCLFGEETFEIRGDLKEILGKHLGVGRGDKPVSPGNGKKDSTG